MAEGEERELRWAAGERDLAEIRQLFREYQRSLDVDLCFQGFEEELATLPGAYAPPSGRLILALHRGRAAGCVGLRPLAGGDCEMKRLFVRPEFRGLDLGRRLAQRLIGEARAAGHRRLLLDTLPSMTAAQALYRRLGFRPIAPYTANPVPGALFLGLEL
jgi:ribosomal protein S18 acetylase RimI-like enzyme